MSSILHILSHDILNQIMLIDVSATLLSSEITSTPESEKRLGMIQSTVRNISDVITRVKSITRLDDGKFNLDLIPFNPLDLPRQIDEVFQHRLTEKNLKLIYDIDSTMNDTSFTLDPVLFTNTIVNNIISNAIKFSYKDSTIKLTIQREENKSVMTFQDFGVGMTEPQVKNVFRTDRNTTTKGTEGERGTGYGMPLIKRYTEAMNGKLELTSTHIDDSPEQHGTIIRLVF